MTSVKPSPSLNWTAIGPWLLLLLIGLPATGLFGQLSYHFRNYSAREGLTQNTVTCLFQDQQGFLWVGTQDGLNRFDGYEFRTFRPEQGNPYSLTDHYLTQIVADPSGKLWIACRYGMACYFPETGQFQQWLVDTNNLFSDQNNIKSLGIGLEGRVWWIDQEGMARSIHPDSTGNQSPRSPAQCRIEYPKPLWRLAYGADQSVWALEEDQLLHTTEYGTWKTQTHLPNMDRTEVRNLQVDRQGRVWLLESRRVHRYTPAENRWEAWSISNLPEGESLFGVEEVRPGEYWLSSTDGLWIWQEQGGKVTMQVVRQREGLATGLPGNRIEPLLRDRQGQIWLGVAGGGLSCHDPATRVFGGIGKADTYTLGLFNPLVWEIAEDAQHRLWIGTANGLHLVEPARPGTPLSAQPDLRHSLVSITHFSGSSGLPPGATITSILPEADGSLLVGELGKGLYRGHPLAKEAFVPYTSDSSADLPKRVYQLYQDAQGQRWAASQEGLWKENQGNWQNLSKADSSLGLHTPYTMAVYRDRAGAVYASTASGAYRLPPEATQWQHFAHQASDTTSLGHNVVTCFLEDRAGNFWVGTLGGGLHRMNRKSGAFERWTEADGLVNNHLYSLQEDGQGRIWMSTNRGIAVFVPEEERFAFFDMEDGLLFNEFCQNAAFQSSIGELFFGSGRGVVFFHPDSVQLPQALAPVVLTGLEINYQPEAVVPDSELVLTHDQKVLSFTFAALDLQNNRRLHYAYQLEGFDPDWVAAKPDRRLATYSSLPAGTYTFRVRAARLGEAWSANELRLRLVVKPPFWLTWWFLLSMGLLVLGLAGAVIRYYAQRKLRQQLQELEMKQRLQAERQRISRDLHDHVGAHITFIISSLDYLSLQNQNGNAITVKGKLEHLGEYARSTMQQLRETIWAIHKENLSLAEFHRKVQEYAHQMLGESPGLQYSVQLEGPEEALLKPSQALNLFRIVQEGISNISKHAGADEVRLRLVLEEGNHLKLILKDNGKGIPENAGGYGHHGLNNMRSRAEEIKGAFLLRSALGRGTTIEVVVQLEA